MGVPLKAKRLYGFGSYQLDAVERVLLRDGQPVTVPPKDLETLLVLVERAGHIVEKEELLERVWTCSNHGTGAPQSKEKLLVVASGLIGASRDGDFDRASFPAAAERLPTKSHSCGPALCKFEWGRTRGLFCRWPHGGDDCPTRPAPTHPAGRNRANLNRTL